MRYSGKRVLAAVLVVSLPLSGCMTTGGGHSLKINTAPSGALITVEGGGECETPCILTLDRPRRAIIAKAGFVSLDVTLSPSRRSVTVPMELAAASEDVDTEALPEID